MDQLLTWFKSIPFDSKYIWMLYVSLIIFLTGMVHLAWMRLYKKLYAKLEHTPSHWDDALLWSVHKPLGLLIWIVGITYAANLGLALNTIPSKLVPFIAHIRTVGTILVVTWMLIRLTTKYEEIFSAKAVQRHSKIDPGTAHAIGNLVRISILITSALSVLKIQGFDIYPLLTLSGASAIIVGFAAKDLLSNFFGAIMVYLDRPFVIGDTVRSPDRNIEGTVEYIGWRLTRIRSYEKRPLYVPNSAFLTVTVENVTRMSNRRIREFIGVRYKDVKQVKNIADKATEALRNHPHTDQTMTCCVTLHQLGPSSLDLLVFCYTTVTKWAEFLPAKQDIILTLLKVVEECGAECAFPTRTLELPDGVKVLTNT